MPSSVLFVSPVRCLPGHSGRSARILDLVQSFEKRGYDVHFAFVPIREEGSEDQCRNYFGERYYAVPFAFSPWAKYKIFPNKFQRLQHKIISRIADTLGLNNPIYNHKIDEWFSPAARDYLVNIGQVIQPDIVVVEFVFLSWVLPLFDDRVIKVIDTIDLFADSYKRVNPKKRSASQFSTPPDQEILGLERADVVLAIQEEEKAYFASRLTQANVLRMGHSVKVDPPENGSEMTKAIGFFGTPNLNNTEGMNYFFQDILPQLKRKVEGIKLILAGGICERGYEDDAIVKLGNLDNVDVFYRQVSLIINPVLRGKGLSIKTIEALGRGKPVVVTPLGGRGLDGALGRGLIKADTGSDFAQAIADLLAEPQEYHRLSLEAREFARAWNEENETAIDKIVTFRTPQKKIGSATKVM